jgi:hypothetical protein
MKKLIILSILLSAGPAVASGLPVAVSSWRCSELPQTQADAERFTQAAGWAFSEMVRKESPNTWWDCGQKTPAGNWQARGEEIVRDTIASMYRHQLCVDPVGVLATGYNESRGNVCSIGPRTRKAAHKLGLLPRGKGWATYTRDEILVVLNNPKWISRGYVADVGVYQDIYPRYARILDTDGNLLCLGQRRARCRVPKAEELVTLRTSAEVGIHGMLYRHYHFRTRTPWIYWPWTVRDSYSKAVKNTLKNLKTLIQKYEVKHAIIA